MSAPGKDSTSFLMRFWWERRDAEEDRPVLRGMLRNLRTGEEQLVGSLRQLDEHMQRQLSLAETMSAECAGDS